MPDPTQAGIDRLDFDALHDEAVREGREGLCPHCEDAAFEDGEVLHPRLLCWCGVCLAYHHEDYSHEPVDDLEDCP